MCFGVLYIEWFGYGEYFVVYEGVIVFVEVDVGKEFEVVCEVCLVGKKLFG